MKKKKQLDLKTVFMLTFSRTNYSTYVFSLIVLRMSLVISFCFYLNQTYHKVEVAIWCLIFSWHQSYKIIYHIATIYFYFYFLVVLFPSVKIKINLTFSKGVFCENTSSWQSLNLTSWLKKPWYLQSSFKSIW